MNNNRKALKTNMLPKKRIHERLAVYSKKIRQCLCGGFAFLFLLSFGWAQINREAAFGDYKVVIGKYGPQLYYRNTIIGKGAQLYIWNARRTGPLSSGGCEFDQWKECSVNITTTSNSALMTLTKINDTSNIKIEYLLMKDAVRISMVYYVDTQKASVVKYTPFVFPEDLLVSCKYFDAENRWVDKKVPTLPRERIGTSMGRMTEGGEEIILSTTSIGKINIISKIFEVRLNDERFNTFMPDEMRSYCLSAYADARLIGGREFVIDLKIEEPDKTTGLAITSTDAIICVEQIVVPAETNYYENMAARELAGYLEKIFGKKPEIKIDDGQGDNKGCILIGSAALRCGLICSNDLAAVADDGFILKASNGAIGIAGYRGIGTLFGAYAFLEKLGVRFYAKDCEIIPHLANYVVNDFVADEKPCFEFRFVDSPHSGIDHKLRLTGEPDFARTPDKAHVLGHNSAYQCPPDEYLSKHPEYFARDKAGKLYATTNIGMLMLCYSNPDMRAIAATNIIKWVQKDKEKSKFFSVTQGDFWNWCCCSNCQALDPKPMVSLGAIPIYKSDRLLFFVNDIAKQFSQQYPDKIFLTLAYFSTQQAPFKIKPEKNVRVLFATVDWIGGGSACKSHSLLCEENAKALKDFRDWLECAPGQVYSFDYPCVYGHHMEVFGGLYAMIENIKLYAFCGVKGVEMCGAPVAFRGLFFYVWSKLAWNPQLKSQDLINEYLSAYYGQAAPHIRAYLDLLYDTINSKACPSHQLTLCSNPGLVTPAFAEKAYAIFQKAEDAVKDQKIYLKRVHVELIHGVLWSDIDENCKGKMIRDGKVDKDMLLKFKKLVEICAELDSCSFNYRRFYMTMDTKDWLNKVLRIPVETTPWYNDPSIKKLIYGDYSSDELLGFEIPFVQEDIPHGVRLKLVGFTGNAGPAPYGDARHETRKSNWIYAEGDARKDGTNRMETKFYLRKPVEKAALLLEALDDDKPGKTRIAVYCNEQLVFSGENSAAEDKWTGLKFPIKENILHPGWNQLRIVDLEKFKEGDENINQKWFMISDAVISFE